MNEPQKLKQIALIRAAPKKIHRSEFDRSPWEQVQLSGSLCRKLACERINQSKADPVGTIARKRASYSDWPMYFLKLPPMPRRWPKAEMATLVRKGGASQK